MVILAALILSVLVTVYTTAGLRFVLLFIPGNLSLSVSSGSIAQGFTLRDILYSDDSVSLSIAELSAAIKLLSLLDGRVWLRNLDINSLQIDIGESGNSSSSRASVISLPLDITLEDLSINDISLTAPGRDTAHQLQNITLRASSSGQVINVEYLFVTAEQYEMGVSGNIELLNTPQYQLIAQWEYHEDGGNLYAGQSTIAGNTDNTRFTTVLSQPAQVNLELELRDLLGTMTWGGSLDAALLNSALFTTKIINHAFSLNLQAQGTMTTFTASGSLETASDGVAVADIDIDNESIYRIDNIHLQFDIDAQSIDPAAVNVYADINWEDIRGVMSGESIRELSLDQGTVSLQYENGFFQFDGRSGFLLDGEFTGELEASGNGTQEQLTLNRFSLALEQGVLTGQTALRRQNDMVYIDGDANWENLVLPLSDRHVLNMDGGNLTLSGALQDYQLSLQSDLSLEGYSAVHMSLTGRGNQEGMQLSPISLRSGLALIDAVAALQWTDGFAVEASLNGEHINPGEYIEGWDGDLELETSITAGSREELYEVLIRDLNLTGELRERPVVLEMTSAITSEMIDITTATFTSNETQISVSGSWGPQNDLNWSIISTDLNTLHQDYAGSIEASGELTGTKLSPRISGEIRANDIISPWLELGAIATQAIFDQQADLLDIDMQLVNLQYQDRLFDNIELSTSGSVTGHDYTLQLTSSNISLNANGNGNYMDRSWTGQTQTLHLSFDGSDWNNTEPFVNGVTLDGIALLSKLCLQNNITVLCTDIDWKSGNEWNGSISVTDIPLELLNTYLPRNINSSGQVTFGIKAAQKPGEALQGSGNINSNSAEFRFRVDESIIQVFDIENLNGSMDLQNGVLDGQLTMTPSDTQQHPLVASVKLSPVTILPADVNIMDIEGRLSWEVDDLSFASAISPYITDVTGRLAVDMSIYGALTEPGFSGDLALQDATMMFPEFGIELIDVNVRGTPSSVNNLRVTGNARSGEGNLSIDAMLSTSVEDGRNIAAEIRGENFDVINTPEIRSKADTELQLTLNNQRTSLQGQIDIHDALLDLNEIRETATLSEDVILVDASGSAPPKKESRTDLRLHLNFKDNIEIQGQGIRGKLSGDVMISSTENGILLGNGEVRIIDGRYSAYGQTLDIEEGRLIYNNFQLDNPELSIKAVKKVNEEITVGLTVTGFLSDPQVTLISTPAMNDEDTLAYLVFGRPISELTSGEGTNLIGAATALGVKNSGFITRNLSSTFGLDTLELTSDSSGENVSLTVGKYVTPKIYLSYVVGVLESFYTARIRYNMSRRWSLEAKSGEAVGVDLLYSIEK